MVEDVSYTCETAAHFWLLHVLSRWEKFVIEVERRRTPESVQVCHFDLNCCTSAPGLERVRYIELHVAGPSLRPGLCLLG